MEQTGTPCSLIVFFYGMVLRIPRSVAIFVISVLLAATVLATALASSMAMSPYPVLVTFCAAMACIITPVCCYDEQHSDAGDVGWVLTGILATSAIAATIVLYDADEISDISLYLSLTSIVAALLSFVCIYLFFCANVCTKKNNDIEMF